MLSSFSAKIASPVVVYCVSLGWNLVLALVSSANEHCRKAAAGGELYLFGFRLEGTNASALVSSCISLVGWGEGGNKPGLADVVPTGEAEEEVCMVGAGQGHHCGHSPVPSCAGHVL